MTVVYSAKSTTDAVIKAGVHPKFQIVPDKARNGLITVIKFMGNCMKKLLMYPICLVLLVPVVACTASPNSSSAATQPAQEDKAYHTLMAGCGEMVDGKMVYKKLNRNEECMNMSKPGAPMPNGVTMHYDPKDIGNTK